MDSAGPLTASCAAPARSAAGRLALPRLLDLLFRRELKVRYKDSALGFIWTLIRPLAQLLVYAVAIGKFLGASRGLQ